jgi:putative spermidine/putrescine transport system ATP-binding protein
VSAVAEHARPVSATGTSGLSASRIGGRLELDGLRRSFGAYNALAGIDIAIEPGEFIALLGPSGCGKSTALNCIAGLLELTGGEIRLGGRRIDQLEPEKRGFGMVFQSYALFPHMSVRKNVGFGLAMQGIKGPEAEKRIRDALAMVRLESQADKLPGQLSGGQQQRVAIARAIVIRPPIVLMDEPLSNLDAKLRLEMRAEIRAIHDQIGSTTIYVTHDQDEALSLADRIVVMSQGHIQQVGTPEELYQRPVNLTVADFMGFRTRMPGRILSVSGDEAEIEVDGSGFHGLARESLQTGQSAVLAIRPEDLVASATGQGIAATVVSIEYRGRAFFGLARTAAGAELYFRADEPLSRGASAYLSPAPGRALIFRDDAA